MYALICRRCGTRFSTANSTIGFCNACLLTNSIEQQEQERQWREQETRVYSDDSTDQLQYTPSNYTNSENLKNQIIALIGVPIILYIFYKVFF